MFEKEAEEYFRENAYNFDEVTACRECMEFGYNKANEWHDLRKNPKDLPKKVGSYIVCFLDTACERHTFELSFVDYFEDKHWIDEDNHNIEGYDEGVIAWCEIPTFGC
jgi:hypothetical protein